MAAHLHDSVLQTLALIQRHADAPQQARTLAGGRNGSCGAWLYDGRRSSAEDAPGTLATALDGVADEVEADHGVAVDVVVVGDCLLNGHVEALVAAVREAVLNAARHSGADEVSVYAEVLGDSRIEAFVHRGRGFDPAAVNGDRRGITHSIVLRMARHGRAHVTSEPGEGTEVTFELALEAESTRPTPRRPGCSWSTTTGCSSPGCAPSSPANSTSWARPSTSTAVEGIQNTALDVVLLDVHLPGGGAPSSRRSTDAPGGRVPGPVRQRRRRGRDRRHPGRRPRLRHQDDRGDDLAQAVEQDGDAVFSPCLAGFVLDAFAGDLPPGTSLDPELDQITPRERRSCASWRGVTRTRRSPAGYRCRSRRSRRTCRRSCASSSCRAATSSPAGPPTAAWSEPKDGPGAGCRAPSPGPGFDEQYASDVTGSVADRRHQVAGTGRAE